LILLKWTIYSLRLAVSKSRLYALSIQQRFFPLLFAFVLLLSLLATDLAGQDRTGDRPTREQIWSAPTAGDWKRPCLITWQRTWEDALAVSRETGKPILVCVNMDGEIASEHYAGVRYRQPDTAKLYEPYVCVIASVYRHNPRDYDAQGRRILCPRFGSVTCGEHIAIEPGLYKEFFDGKRIAPRHVGVELDGQETYDVYYAFDTDSVFETIRNGIDNRETVPNTVVRGDRPIVERVASRDIRDRLAVEEAYAAGDSALRRSLLQAAREHGEAAQVDLLRLAVFGFDVEMSRLAREALVNIESANAFDLITEALRVPMEPAERSALVGALARLGESAPKARMMAVVHRGLANRSSVIDVDGWTQALENSESPAAPIGIAVHEERIAGQDKVLESGDPGLHVDLAGSFLAFAVEQSGTDKEFRQSLLMDARHTARAAEELGEKSWRVDAIIALSHYYLDEIDDSYPRAEAAVSALPPGEAGWEAMAVLELFARARRESIAEAVRDKRDWSSWSRAFEGTGQWLTDLHTAYSVLDRHPRGTDIHVATHYDFLKLLGASGQAARILDQGLVRFPDSWILHDRLRGRILREKGVAGLEAAYETMLRERENGLHLEWFAGYASLVTAEFFRRRGSESKALAAYDRAIAHYGRSVEVNPPSRETADHYVALALAGRARLAYERGDHEKALEEILLCFAKKPDAAATMDGLGISPVDTAKMLLQRLKEKKRDDLVARLEAAMASLDPELLRLPAYEGEGPRRNFRGRRGQGRGRPPGGGR